MYGALVSLLLFSVLGKVVCDISRPAPKDFPVGTQAIIKGIPVANDTNLYFNVNLLPQSPVGEGDIDFHMGVRFGQGAIVFNSFISGVGQSWQEELYRNDSPIQAGIPFEIGIIVEPHDLGIFINRKFFGRFSYRKPRRRIKYLQVVGSVNVSLISVAMVPNYVWPLPNGFPDGSRTVIRGIPDTDFTPQAFYINLFPQSPFGDGDIDFHLATRFSDGVTVLNNFILGKSWQQEIFKRDPPIQAGKPFEITILAEQSHLRIYINGNHWDDFAYRKPRERIKYLQVYGGVIVSLLSVDMKRFD